MVNDQAISTAGGRSVLTEQERRVALAVGQGATNKATARRLGISIKTVEFHLGNIYRKLDVSGRAELAHLLGSGRLATVWIDGMSPSGIVDGHDSLEALAGALADGAAGAAPFPTELRNPYKGLRAFQESDAADFFGRERLVERILALLSGSAGDGSSVTVVGPSGCGKSSVVLAGVLPAVRQGAIAGSVQWTVATMLPGSQPSDALVAALHERDEDALPAARDVILVIDQLEELYTLCGTDARARFADDLAEAMDDPGHQVRVITTLRADFYERVLHDPGLAPLLETGTVPVPPLTDDELEQAVVGPAGRSGATIEPGLAAVLVSDVRGQPGALPLLQYALTELFDRSEHGLLRLDDYREIGGVGGAVSTRAEELYRAGTAIEQPATRRVLTRLVSLGEGTEDTRRRVRVRELGDLPGTRVVLARFGQARLLSFDRDPRSGEPTIELAHEALLREWPRLQSWLTDDRDGLRIHRELTISASAWDERGRDAGELYRGGRLEVAERWSDAHGDDLNPTEARFLSASLAQRQVEADTERRNVLRIKRGLVLVAAVAVVALVAGALAWSQQRHAESAAREAASERDAARAAEFAAETGRLATLAPTLAETNPALALLLAAEAETRDASPETWGALEQTFVTADAHLGFLGPGEALQAAFFDGEETILGVGRSRLSRWDATTHKLRDTVELPVPIRPRGLESNYQHPQAFANGTLAWVGEDDQAHVLTLDTGEHVVAPFASSVDVALDAEASRLAVVNGSGDVAMFELPGLRQLWLAGGDGELSVFDAGQAVDVVDPVPDLEAYPATPVLAFTPDGGTLVVARAWNVTTRDVGNGDVRGSAVFPFYVLDLGVERAPAGRVVAMSYHGVSAAARPALDGVTTVGLDNRLPVIESAVTGLPDGRIAVLDPQGHVIVLAAGAVSEPGPAPTNTPHPASSATVDTLDSHVAGARSLALSPDGSTLLVAGDGGAALVSVSGGGLTRRAVPRTTDHAYFIGGPDASWIGSAPNITMAPTDQMHLFRSESRLWRCTQDGCTEHRPAIPPTKEITAAPERNLLVVYTYTASGTSTQQFFDGKTFEPVSPPIETPHEGGGWIAVADDRTWMIHADSPNSLDVVELATGHLLFRSPLTWASHPGGAVLPGRDAVLVFNPDNGESFVLDVRTGEETPSPLPAGEAAIVAFSHSGKLVATADLSGEVVVRDGATFEVLHRLNAAEPVSPFMSMAFSDDDRFLLTVHPTGGRLWDVASGLIIGQRIPTLEATAPSALPGQATHLLTAARQWVQIWDLDVGRWEDIACMAAGRNLTRQEWEQVGPRDQPYHATCPQWPAA
jgi:DNA-binding CsgD family transcriptional regulator/WD40 repeat protein